MAQKRKTSKTSKTRQPASQASTITRAVAALQKKHPDMDRGALTRAAREMQATLRRQQGRSR